MGLIGPTTSVAKKPHRVFLQNPGPSIPDGDGGSTQTWFDMTPPTAFARIANATAADLERVAAGTVISSATRIVTIDFHPQVTTKSRVLFDGRILNVTGGASPEERQVELVLVCVEVVP